MTRQNTPTQGSSSLFAAGWTGLAILAVFALLLSASSCLTPGDDDDDDTTTESPSATESPVPTEAPRRYVEFATGTSQNDRATVVYEVLDPPPSGSVYVGWLVDDAGTGYLNIGNHDAPDDLLIIIYNSPTNEDLLATYSQAVISIEDEATADTLTEPTGTIAFAGALSGDLLTYGRELLVSWPGHPVDGTTACAHGFVGLAEGLETHVHEANDEWFVNGDLPAALDRAELVYNLQKGLYERYDLDDDLSVEVSPADDGFGVTESTNGVDTYAGYVNACEAIIGDALANEPPDSPAVQAMADLDVCVSDVRAESEASTLAALAIWAAISSTGDADAIVSSLHDQTDMLIGTGQICFRDWGYEMMRIQLGEP